MADCVAVLRTAAATAGVRALSFRGRSAEPFAEPERLSVAESELVEKRTAAEKLAVAGAANARLDRADCRPIYLNCSFLHHNY